MKPAAEVRITLSADQALVFFEWLTREDGKGELPTEHQAEQNVLWEIEAQLERTLLEPVQPDYAAKVASARERLIGEHDE